MATTTKIKATPLYKVESNIPLPKRKAKGEVQAKMREILSQMKVGYSALILKGEIGALRKIADSEFPEYRVRTTQVVGNKTQVRIYRTA